MRVKPHLHCVLVASLFLVTDSAFGQTFDCDPGSNESPLVVQLDLVAEPAIAKLQGAGPGLELSPLERSGNIVLFSELGPGTDDERFITYRMLRFDLGAGQLDYVQHVPTFKHIQARCSPR